MFLTTITVRRLREATERHVIDEIARNRLDELRWDGRHDFVEVVAHGHVIAVLDARPLGPAVIWARPRTKVPVGVLLMLAQGGVQTSARVREAGMADGPEPREPPRYPRDAVEQRSVEIRDLFDEAA